MPKEQGARHVSLENRPGTVSYYRKVRVDGQVKSIYVASGEAAKSIAAKQKQEATRQAELDAIAQAVAQFCSEVDDVMTETLQAAGYHNHRGEWRKARK